uniref:NADH-ubiquinone oxidoreductase chain 5 n=1 Tax=Ptenothrix huangshanensis TaxID=2583244 RepID=A0A6H0EWZ4_9HEXA|nr:NADH dehydrogenase subunit 5 [Ptenothrix huangshanensis]
MKFNNICLYLGLMLSMCSFLTIYFSFILFFNQLSFFIEWEFISLNSISLVVLFFFDWMSLSFSGVVLLISSLVLLYSFSYMKGDPNQKKFIFLVFLFVVSMLLMVTSPNLISILLGWDGLGLVSYCLVIYYQNNKSANAGMITVLSNRIGDVALLLAISWMLNFGSCNFYYITYIYSNYHLIILFSLVMIAAMTKSAQIPFSAWLPAAMAAPTPVSSLVHSSTLVTAGVYLLIRFSSVINMNYILFLIAVLTMFMSGLGANYEMDLKKVIALSTLSQLGVMMMVLSLGMSELAYFHLLGHALFKSLLFLCAGFFIHAITDCQDIRYLSSLWYGAPIISIFFFAASISLCGFPFMTGFYTKDLILEFFFMKNMNLFMLCLIYLSTLFTLMYSFRLIFFSFMGSFSFKVMLSKQDDSEMFIPMSILFFMSISGGSMIFWLFFPNNFIYMSFWMKMFILLSLISVFLLIFMSKSGFFKTGFSKNIFFMSSMWNLPYISSIFFVKMLYVGLNFIKIFDQGWLEYFGGQMGYKNLVKNSTLFDKMNMLDLKSYLFFIVFILILLVQLLYLNSLNLKRSVEVTKMVLYF